MTKITNELKKIWSNPVFHTDKTLEELAPIDRFIYWIAERHRIFLKRSAGMGRPWTDDPTLQTTFFTNPYRENDKVTIWFRENVREPLRDDPAVILATTIFRWFNYIPTGIQLIAIRDGQFGALTNWNKSIVEKRLIKLRKFSIQVFTGAFMINSPGGKGKVEAICERIDAVWKDRNKLIADLHRTNSMKDAHKRLMVYEGLGGFMAYEIVCDLRYTHVLENAIDIDTWCHIGPGATRGLRRVLGLPFKKGSNSSSPPAVPNGLDRMAEVLKAVRDALPEFPHIEMREIEHSLCEFDKYERARLGDGRMKRLYNGIG